MSDPLNILITCVGRRVSLVRHFQRALEAEQAGGRVFGVDVSKMSAAMHVVDAAEIVPSTCDEGYVDALLDLIQREGIRLIVPTADFDLEVLSQSRDRFEKARAKLLSGGPKTMAVCRDKLKTHRFFADNGFDTPATWSTEQVLAGDCGSPPLFVKPRCGSAAKGNFIVRTPEQLAAVRTMIDDPIAQELIDGIEHTLDVFVDFDGSVRCVVPRRRLAVRGGEVIKSRTVRHKGMIDGGRRVVEALGDCLGVVTIQLFLCPDGQIRFIEINPRFGGGCPLSIRAGADFPLWIVRLMLGRDPGIDADTWQDGLTMLRYDEEVFVASNGSQRRGGSDECGPKGGRSC